jgi:hypothetical protein
MVFLLTLALIFASPFAFNQIAFAQTPITARAEPTRLSLDEQLTLNVTISGDFLNIPNPDLSQLQDFVVVSSSTSTQVSIVNGKMSSQKIFLYRLQPLAEGNLVIGPVSVNIGGQVYQTEPIGIEVLNSPTQIVPPAENNSEAEMPDTLSGQDFYIEAEVDNPVPYLGEQIIYTFRLYQAANFFGQPDYKPPAFTDFWSSEIVSRPHYNIDSHGRQYLVSEIRTALFPANLGSIGIDPGTLIVPGGLFNPDIKLETNPVQVEVRPLPEGAPTDFTGAVGQFQIRATLNEEETKVNEPVTLLVEIEGTGNIQTLTEPELPELPGWRVFESQSTTRTESGADKITGVRSFERLVVPGLAGEQSFPPISFSYYDPQVEAYQTIRTAPVPITIVPDETATPPAIAVEVGEDGKLSVERISNDIRHIKNAPTSLSPSESLLSTGWIVVGCVWIAPLLAVGGVFVWQRRLRRLRHDAAFARDQRARRDALRILAEAGQSGGLTTAELVRLLKQARLEPDLIKRVEATLHQIDVGRFAPTSAEAPDSILDETKKLIVDLEKSMGRRR